MLTEEELSPILDELEQEFSGFCKSQQDCRSCPLYARHVGGIQCRMTYLAQKYAQEHKELMLLKQ